MELAPTLFPLSNTFNVKKLIAYITHERWLQTYSTCIISWTSMTLSVFYCTMLGAQMQLLTMPISLGNNRYIYINSWQENNNIFFCFQPLQQPREFRTSKVKCLIGFTPIHFDKWTNIENFQVYNSSIPSMQYLDSRKKK